MGYRDRYASEWISFTDEGTEYESRAILYEGYGGNPELDINMMNDAGDTVHSVYTFRVTEMQDRECVFRNCSRDGLGKPSQAALRSLALFGWTCENYDIESMQARKTEKVQPTLKTTTSTLNALIRNEHDPIGKHPFLLDLLEQSMYAVSFVNMLLSVPEVLDVPEEMDAPEELGEQRDDPIAYLLEEGDEEIKNCIIAECKRNPNPLSEQILPQVARRHCDMDLSEEAIKQYEISDLSPRMQDSLTGNFEGVPKTVDLRNFDELRDLASEVSDRNMAGTGGINTFTKQFELRGSTVTVQFVKIKSVNMPYVVDQDTWEIPTTDDDIRETVKKAVMNGVRDENPSMQFARSVEEAREMCLEQQSQ